MARNKCIIIIIIIIIIEQALLCVRRCSSNAVYVSKRSPQCVQPCDFIFVMPGTRKNHPLYTQWRCCSQRIVIKLDSKRRCCPLVDAAFSGLVVFDDTAP